MAQNLGCFPSRGGQGQFWNQEASISRESTTTCAFRNQDLVATGFRNTFQFCCNSHFRHRAHGVQRDGISFRPNRKLGQQFVVDELDGIQKNQPIEALLIFRSQIRARCF